MAEKYIDMHVHVGSWSPDGVYFEKEQLLNVMKKNNISSFCVSTLDCIDMDSVLKKTPKTEIEGNLDLLKMFEDTEEAKFLAVCEPNAGNVSNIEKLLDDNQNKFAGLKMHPMCHQIPADSALYDPYMELAQKRNLPCLFHSGHLESPYSSPKLICELAKRHKTVPVILGHLSTGGMSSKKETLKLMKRLNEAGEANLYADISWCDIDSIVKAVAKAGAERIMFASDAPLGIFGDEAHYSHFVEAIERALSANFDSETVERVFWKNSQELFKIY